MIEDYLQRIITALDAGPSVPDWIGAIAAVVTTLIAGSALWFAAAQVKEAKVARDAAQHEAKAARDLSQQLEIERAQPYVVAFSEPSAATDLATDLVIRNFGQTAARDVRITLDPWPRRDHETDGDDKVGIPELPILAPGQEWRTSWSWGPDRTKSDLPKRHEGEIRYLGIGDAERTSPVILDLSVYDTRQWIETRSIHDVGQSLREIQATLKKWTEGQQGLSVYTRSGRARDDALRERHERMLRQRQARAERAEHDASATAAEPGSPDGTDTPTEQI